MQENSLLKLLKKCMYIKLYRLIVLMSSIKLFLYVCGFKGQLLSTYVGIFTNGEVENSKRRFFMTNKATQWEHFYNPLL